MFTFSTHRYVVALVVVLANAVWAHAQVRPKFTAAQINEAETKLRQANCALHYEKLPPLVPDGPLQKGPVEIVAFPADITDMELAKLMPMVLRFPNITTIGLSNCTRVSTKGLKEVLKLNDMKALFLDNTGIDGDGLKELKALRALQWLDLSNTMIRDNDLLHLEDVGALHHLAIDHCRNLTAEGMENLQKLQRLRSLQVTIESNQAAMMTQIAKLQGLLELKVQPISDSEATKIAELKKLQVLDINADFAVWRNRQAMQKRIVGGGMKPGMAAGNRPVRDVFPRGFAVHSVSEKGFTQILKCGDLRTLRVAGHPLDVQGSGLEKLEFLQELDLSGTNIADDGIGYLGKLRGLKKLALASTAVTNTGVRELSACGSLEAINLDYLPITDEAIRYLAQNRKLKELSLNGTRVAMNDRSAWMSFPRLETIELCETNVTDASILTMAKFKTLKHVDLRQNCPNVTFDGLQSLRRELLRTEILGYACEGMYWVGGGGVPIVKRPDLDYKIPNARPTNTQTNPPPMAPPKAPPPPVRVAPIGTSPK